MATSWTTPTNTATPWTASGNNPLTYAQASRMTFNEAGRTFNAVEQSGAKKLYNGILSTDLKQLTGQATTWT